MSPIEDLQHLLDLYHYKHKTIGFLTVGWTKYTTLSHQLGNFRHLFDILR